MLFRSFFQPKAPYPLLVRFFQPSAASRGSQAADGGSGPAVSSQHPAVSRGQRIAICEIQALGLWCFDALGLWCCNLPSADSRQQPAARSNLQSAICSHGAAESRDPLPCEQKARMQGIFRCGRANSETEMEQTKTKRKASCSITRTGCSSNRQRPILPDRFQSSTFGVQGLNYCVRHGNRWIKILSAAARLRKLTDAPTRRILLSKFAGTILCCACACKQSALT